MRQQDGTRHLAIVERNEVGRLGRVAVAQRALGAGWRITGAGPASERDGMAEGDVTPAGERVDVVLAVVGPDGPAFDRFDLVTHLRAWAVRTADGDRPWIVAAVDSDNPLLRVRLAAAGVDRIVGLSEVSVSAPGVFAGAVSGSDESAARPGPGAPLGTDPDGVLEYVARHHLEAAFEPGLSQAETGLSRRAVQRIRRDIAGLGGIRPSLDRYTGGADRSVELPTWRDIVTYVNCARGEVDWGDDAWGHRPGPRIGMAHTGVRDLELAARELVA
jgi:hypothetical protein